MDHPHGIDEICEEEIKKKGSFNFKQKKKSEEEDDSPSESFMIKPVVATAALNAFDKSKTEAIDNIIINKINSYPLIIIFIVNIFDSYLLYI
jgi:hypothetical protein